MLGTAGFLPSLARWRSYLSRWFGKNGTDRDLDVQEQRTDQSIPRDETYFLSIVYKIDRTAISLVSLSGEILFY